MRLRSTWRTWTRRSIWFGGVSPVTSAPTGMDVLGHAVGGRNLRRWVTRKHALSALDDETLKCVMPRLIFNGLVVFVGSVLPMTLALVFGYSGEPALASASTLIMLVAAPAWLVAVVMLGVGVVRLVRQGS